MDFNEVRRYEETYIGINTVYSNEKSYLPTK
jgi:hypothetical protein